jgi:hypothetical protein
MTVHTGRRDLAKTANRSLHVIGQKYPASMIEDHQYLSMVEISAPKTTIMFYSKTLRNIDETNRT